MERSYGSKATTEKAYLGKVHNYFSHANAAEILLEAGALSQDDNVIITGPTTGIIQTKAESIFKDGSKVSKAEKCIITLKVPEKARKNDKVYAVRQIIKT